MLTNHQVTASGACCSKCLLAIYQSKILIECKHQLKLDLRFWFRTA